MDFDQLAMNFCKCHELRVQKSARTSYLDHYSIQPSIFNGRRLYGAAQLLQPGMALPVDEYEKFPNHAH